MDIKQGTIETVTDYTLMSRVNCATLLTNGSDQFYGVAGYGSRPVAFASKGEAEAMAAMWNAEVIERKRSFLVS